MKFYIENVSHGVLEIIEGDNPLAALQAYGKQCIRPHTAEELIRNGFSVREIKWNGGRSMTGADLITPGEVIAIV